MHSKLIKLFILILVVLVVISTDSLWRPYLEKIPGLSSSQAGSGFGQLDQLTQLTLSDEDQNQVTLVYQDNRWQVDGFPVDQDKLNRFLGELDGLEPRDEYLVSTNAEKYANYRVADNQGIQLTLEWPNRQARLIIGDVGQQAGTTHLRFPDMPGVYLTPTTIRSLASTTADDWRHKIILDLPAASLESLTLESPGTTLLVDRDDQGNWQATRGTQTVLLTQTDSNRLASAFSPLEASSFADPETANTFINTFPKTTVTLQTATGQQTLSLLQNPDTASWLASLDDHPTVYLLSSATVDTFLLDESELF